MDDNQLSIRHHYYTIVLIIFLSNIVVVVVTSNELNLNELNLLRHTCSH